MTNSWSPGGTDARRGTAKANQLDGMGGALEIDSGARKDARNMFENPLLGLVPSLRCCHSSFAVVGRFLQPFPEDLHGVKSSENVGPHVKDDWQ